MIETDDDVALDSGLKDDVMGVFVGDSRSFRRDVTSDRTPSKALNKVVDPSVKAVVSASRVGASCSSSRKSCNPSVNHTASVFKLHFGLHRRTSQPQTQIRNGSDFTITRMSFIQSAVRRRIVEMQVANSPRLAQIKKSRIRLSIPFLKSRRGFESRNPSFRKGREDILLGSYGTTIREAREPAYAGSIGVDDTHRHQQWLYPAVYL